jgi:quercetin dioxygenase-like cupin family protein
VSTDGMPSTARANMPAVESETDHAMSNCRGKDLMRSSTSSLRSMRGLAIIAAAASTLGITVAASSQSLPLSQPAVTQTSATAQAAPARAEGRIWRKGSPPVSVGPAANFTGTVHVLAPWSGTGGSRLRGGTVMFQPGARTAWHRHPMGQTLIVTEGCGWTQREGGSIERICAGDVAWVAPGEMHWHGATPTTAMTHVTASETVEGQNVQWLEKVSDEQYRLGPD